MAIEGVKGQAYSGRVPKKSGHVVSRVKDCSGATAKSSLPAEATLFDPHYFSFFDTIGEIDLGERGTVAAGERKGSGNRSARLPRFSPLCVTLLLVLLGSVCVGLLVHMDRYLAETELVFIKPNGNAPKGMPWFVEEELHKLKSFDVAYRVANAVSSMPDAPSRTTPVAWEPYNEQILPDTSDFPSSGLAGWLLRHLSVEVYRADDMAKVILSLSGDDPAFLKALLQAYATHYIDSRHELGLPVGNAGGPTRATPRQEKSHELESTIDEELSRMDMLQRHCELALKLLDSGKSPFSGFAPTSVVSSMASLNHINEELVKLAIERNRLKTRYLPASREIREIDQQIMGLKGIMREYMVQQLTFLRGNRQQALARKKQLECRGTPASGMMTRPSQNQFVTRIMPEDQGIKVNSDLFILHQGPITVRMNPVYESYRTLKNRLSRFLFNGWWPLKSPIDSDPLRDAPGITCGLSVAAASPRTGNDDVHGSPKSHGWKETGKRPITP